MLGTLVPRGSHFVTNSSSSSYMILALDDDVVDKIINKENLQSKNEIPWNHNFKVNRLEAVYDSGFRWLGFVLNEQDLRQKTLNQLEIELVDDINKEYNLGITIDDIYFDNDIVYG